MAFLNERGLEHLVQKILENTGSNIDIEPIREAIRTNAEDIDALFVNLEEKIGEGEALQIVKNEIAKLVGSAPSTLDTIYELADALEDNADAIDLLESAVGNKASKTDLNNHINATNPHGITAAGIDALPTSGGSITGNLYLANKPTAPNIHFKPTSYSDATTYGTLQANAEANSTKNRFQFLEYSRSSSDYSRLSKFASFSLPNPDADMTEDKHYYILTSKDPVSIPQGGTGATDAATARTKLGITPENIGAAPAEHGTHLTLGTTSSTAFRGDYGNTAYQHSQSTHAPSNAQANQNAFSNVKIGSTTIAADTTTDTLTLVAGDNITLTPDAANDKITIAATDTTYSAATTSADGLMTAAMVNKLNGIASGANAYTHPSHTSKSSGLYKITVDAQGHVSAATAVAKADITALGIPAQDTTYSAATASAAGLMSTGAQTFAGAKTFNDALSAKKITITDTAAAKHISFSREGWNYITAPVTGTIALTCADEVDSDTATLAVTAEGTTLRGTTNVAPGALKLKTLNIPTSSGGSTYGAGTSGQVLKTNGTTVYWGSDSGSDAVSKTSTTTQLMAASIALRDRSTTEDSWKYFGSTRYITSAEKGYTFQMGIGSAGAATLLLYESSDTNTSLNSMTLNPDNTVFKKPVTISSGGTGATTATEACNNLGAAIVGVGESIPSGADLNTYTTPGSYRSYQASISASLLNTPYTGTGFKLEVFNTTTANQIMQEIKANAATSRTYRRTASLSDGTWTFNNWVKVMHSTSDTLAIQDGGTGCNNARDVQSLFMNSYKTTKDIDISTMDVYTLAPGIYHHENATSTSNHYPTEGARALVEVKGSYRTGTVAADGYPNGYWSIRVYYPYSGEEYWNHRVWSAWTGWALVYNSDVKPTPEAIGALASSRIVYSSTQPAYSDGRIWFKPV